MAYSVQDQGALNEELKKDIFRVGKLGMLEELFLPYKSRRETKASIARKHGLGKLVERILAGEEHHGF